jgi:outer membrane protein assembly factor BamB
MQSLVRPSRHRAPARGFPLVFLNSMLWSVSVCADNWPAWRGADGLGITREKNLPVHWSATENIRWKIALPDRGNSSPIVWGNRIFITQALEKEERLTVMGFDRAGGRRLWQSGTSPAGKYPTHKTNPYGSSSPVTDGERVMAWFGSAGLFCFDLDGKELWHRDLGRQSHIWGYGSSPVIHGDLCLLNFGPGERSFLIALNKKTGETVWQVDVPQRRWPDRMDGFAGKPDGESGSWSTPLVLEVNGRDEVIVSWPGQLRGFDPKTGKEQWHCDGLDPLVYASPIYGEGIIAAMSGFMGSAIAVRTGGSGDVTATHRLWKKDRTKNRICSGVITGGHIYVMNMEGVAECLDLKTGRMIWEERVAGPGPKSDSWSSMVLAGDRIYLPNQSGDVIVLRASPKFGVLAVNSIGREMCNASLAVSEGELFLRTDAHLWCIGQPGAKAAGN